jgi:hypothetical protein
MAWWIQVLEIAKEDGSPSGKYRLTAKSDEQKTGPKGLCQHEHATREEARACTVADATARMYG